MQRLSSDCEDQIRIIIQESALDYRLDPQLQLHCSDEVGSGDKTGCEQSWSEKFYWRKVLYSVSLQP